MKNEKFLELFGNIDDRFIEEANAEVKAKSRINLGLYIGIAAGLIVVAGIVISLATLIVGNESYISTNSSFYDEETYGTIPSNLEPTEANLEETTTSDGGAMEDSCCGGDGELYVDGLCIVFDGLEYQIPDEEGYAFIEENYVSIKSALISFGVSAENLVIREHGFSHYSTETGSIALNFRDYLAYNDGEIVAIVTLVNDEYGMTYYLATEALWFESYTELLEAHQGEELVYIYIGTAEAIITPDNKIIYVMSGEEYQHYIDGVDYYSVFNQDVNTYVP